MRYLNMTNFNIRFRLEHAPLWRLLLENPLWVSSTMLESMMALSPVAADTNPPSTGSTVFYIRSFHFGVSQLQTILYCLLDDQYHMNERVFAWLETIMQGAHEDPEESDDSMSDDWEPIVTVRYCGQTKNNPWDRHVSDIYSTSLSGFLSRFFKEVNRMDCSILATASVHTVIGAGTNVPLAGDYTDVREQALIALFGDGVLNIEAGGKDTIVMTDHDQSVFLSLGTATADLIQSSIWTSSNNLKNKIHRYASDIQEYVQENPSTRGGGKYVFTAQVFDFIREQAFPRTLPNGIHVFLTVASDIGELHDNRDKAFFQEVEQPKRWPRAIIISVIGSVVSVMIWMRNTPRSLPKEGFCLSWILSHGSSKMMRITRQHGNS